MISLEDRVREVFAQGGALSRAADQFRERDGQTRMALAVAQVIEEGGPLVQPPAASGFGSTVIRTAFKKWGGRSRISFRPEGVICRMRIPLATKPAAALHSGHELLYPAILDPAA